MAIRLETKKKRFKLLIKMLENHKKIFPKVKFNLTYWAANMDKKGKDSTSVKCLLDGKCGTAACAIGSAMLYKPFNKMGFTAEFLSSGDSKFDNFFVPVYKHYHHWKAVHMFLDLSPDDSSWLFQSHSYEVSPRPSTVAKRIQKFMDNGFKKP